jgi:hypothetical protein
MRNLLAHARWRCAFAAATTALSMALDVRPLAAGVEIN